MKIAIAVDGLQIGGIERVCADYVKLLIEMGHVVTVFNLNPALTDMECELPGECKLVHLPYPRRLAPEQYAQLIKRGYWGKLIYPIAYTILTMANWFYKGLCRIYKTECRKNYDLSVAFAGHFNDLTFVAEKYLKSKTKMCWLHGALYGYLLVSDGFVNLYNKIKNLIVLVDDAQEEVFCTNKQLKLNVFKLYNPTFIKNRTVNENHVKELKKRYGKFMVMVSRFQYPHKDQFTVAKALKIVREKYQDDINLVFVGDGPDRKNVEEYVAGFHEEIKQHIYFSGNQMEVQDYYSAAYLLVHASVAGEGLPTIMLEAMAYDLPQVVTDSKVGPREILGNDEYGLLCKVKDGEDMAYKIHKLITDPQLYRYYIDQGRKRIKDFEPETIKEQLKKILDRVVTD